MGVVTIPIVGEGLSRLDEAAARMCPRLAELTTRVVSPRTPTDCTT
jgi:hypothetical protein